jgi:hypothetical protein
MHYERLIQTYMATMKEHQQAKVCMRMPGNSPVSHTPARACPVQALHRTASPRPAHSAVPPAFYRCCGLVPSLSTAAVLPPRVCW